MKVILCMAMSVDGYIAREDGSVPWSETVWENFFKFMREKKNIIVGRKTYELMKADGEFEKAGNPFTVVVSKTKNIADNAEVMIVASPGEALKIMEQKGFEEVILGGGGTLNAAFLKENLIDEMILDVEPLVFGKGIKLFKDTDTEVRLELLEIRALSKNTIRLQYKVIS